MDRGKDISELPPNKKVVLFDGICNLCNRSVQFIIKHDKKDIFRFASLQSEFGQELIRNSGMHSQKVDSILLVEPGEHVFIKSTAALKIAAQLERYSGMRFLLFLPRFLRDAVYTFIARNRYKWFGKRDECMIPTPELKSKFIEK